MALSWHFPTSSPNNLGNSFLKSWSLILSSEFALLEPHPAITVKFYFHQYKVLTFPHVAAQNRKSCISTPRAILNNCPKWLCTSKKLSLTGHPFPQKLALASQWRNFLPVWRLAICSSLFGLCLPMSINPPEIKKAIPLTLQQLNICRNTRRNTSSATVSCFVVLDTLRSTYVWFLWVRAVMPIWFVSYDSIPFLPQFWHIFNTFVLI